MSSYSQTQNNFYSSKVNPQYAIKDNYKNRQNQTKLWLPSQTSLNFVSPRLSFTKQQRFKLHSIYYPQNNELNTQFLRANKQRSDIDSIAKQISKRIDQQEKNELRIKRKFSQQQKRVVSIFKNNTKKKHQKNLIQMKQFNLDKKNLQITQRLTGFLPRRQSLLRDRHGGRSNLILGEDQHLHQVVKDEIERLVGSPSAQQKTGISSPQKTKIMGKTITFSKRINLNLPHNYYPGVGAYEIKRYLQQFDDLDKRRALTARDKINRQK